MAMPDPFSGSASSWATTGTRAPKSGVTTSVPNRAPVALVLGMGHQGHAGGQQLGPGGLDVDGAVVAGPGEPQPVVGARELPVLELGLGHRGPEVDVPQGGGGALGHLAPPGQAEEAALGDPLGLLGDGGIGVRPVHRQAERPPQVLEDLLVLGGEPVAQGHEVGTRDGDGLLARLGRWLEPGVEGEARVAADPEVVLHPPFGGQPVVVPSHRVEHGPAPHALEAGHGVGVGVREDVADVERPGHGGRRGVDGEDLGPGGGPVEGVGAVLLPPGGPCRLEPFQPGLVGDAGGSGREWPPVGSRRSP